MNICTLNKIAACGTERFGAGYTMTDTLDNASGVMVRSAAMHDMELPETLAAIARAGAGVNNIPVDACSEKGIVVFNTPGANANAVKELVLAGMLMAARNIPQAWDFARNQQGDDAVIDKAVEAGKKNYVGFELPGKTLGVVGLGAIGVRVANAARALGMNVIGFDPFISVESAWSLSTSVHRATKSSKLLFRARVHE